jgi:hypothetical protein
VTQQPRSGLNRLISEVPRSHTIRHTEVVGFPWTSDQIVAKTATHTPYKMQRTEEAKTHVLRSLAGFASPIPAIKQLQTWALNHTAAGMGSKLNYVT